MPSLASPSPRRPEVDRADEPTVTVTIPSPLVGWGAVIGGFVVGAGLIMLLSVLGVAVGVRGLGAALWAASSLLVGFFVGGVASARATNHPDRGGAVIQAMLVWVLGVGAAAALIVSGAGFGAIGLFQGLPTSLAAATRVATDAGALDELRARVARARDDPARVATEVDAFLEQHPPAAPERHARLGAGITFGALLVTLLASTAGALMATPDPDRWR